MASVAYPDENSHWNEYTAAVNTTYDAGGREKDDGRFKWFTRHAYDVGAGLPVEVSRAKHLDELREECRLSFVGRSIRPDPPGGLQPYPDENSYWNDFTAAVNGLYDRAVVAPDDGRFKWSTRTAWDIAGLGLTSEASRAKHLHELTVALGLTSPRPVPQARAALPPFDRDAADPDTGAALPVHTTPIWTPPSSPTLEYIRANLWGVTIPGLPSIAGGASGPARERGLTYLLDRYPPEWQDRYLRGYVKRGLTHWWLSIPDSMKGPSRLSVGQYVDLSKRVRDAGIPFVCHFLRSKDYDGRNPDPSAVYGVVEALAAADLIPMASHAWEASLWYTPAAFRATIDSDAIRFRGIHWCVHLQQQYADYGPDGREDHGPIFWKANLAVGVKTLLYQYQSDPLSQAWTAGMMQARGNDVSVRFIRGGLWGLPETVNWACFELIAQQLFNNQRDGDGRVATEDIGDLKGFETALCTPGPLGPCGFGNGCRYPSGDVV